MIESSKREPILYRIGPPIGFILIVVVIIGLAAMKSNANAKEEAYNNKRLDVCLQKLENEQNPQLLGIKQQMCFKRWDKCK